jgi:large subunit ribosomal protein L18
MAMQKTQYKRSKRVSRHNRIRAKVAGTADCPRLAVFRSNRYIYAQLINDEEGKTLGAVDSRKLAGKTLSERATAVGTKISELATKAKIEKVVFDRGGFRYQGTVAALAEGARAGGLKF